MRLVAPMCIKSPWHSDGPQQETDTNTVCIEMFDGSTVSIYLTKRERLGALTILGNLFISAEWHHKGNDRGFCSKSYRARWIRNSKSTVTADRERTVRRALAFAIRHDEATRRMVSHALGHAPVKYAASLEQS